MILFAVPIGWMLGYFTCLAHSANKGWAYLLFMIAMFMWHIIVTVKYGGGEKDE